jgi:hypothetical protein
MKQAAILTLIGAASALALTATAASAQPMGGGRWVSIQQREVQLERRIESGVRRGDLTRPEARRLYRELRQVANLEDHYRVDGLSRWERADLDRRFDRLSAQVRFERRDNQYGYGYGPGRR